MHRLGLQSLFFILLLATQTLSNTAFAKAETIIPLPQQLLNEKLQYAIGREKIDLAAIDQLIKKGARTDDKSLLKQALKWKQAQALQHLLIASYPTLESKHYNELLHAAVDNEDWASTAILLQHSGQRIERSLTFKIAKKAHIATFKLIQDRNILDDIRNPKQQCLLDSAVIGDNNDIVRWFLKQDISLKGNKHCNGLITIAAKNNNQALIAILLQEGVTIHGTEHSHSPVHIAIKQGNVSLVQFLLEKGADLYHYKDDKPLLNAAFYGHNDLLAYLLEHQKKPLIQTPNLLSVLALSAAKGGQLDTLKFLQQRGANLKHKISRPLFNIDTETLEATTTALHLAAEKGHRDVVDYLLTTAKLEINAVDQKRGTALLLAITNDHLDTVRLLHQKQARYHVKGMQQLPLQAAIHREYVSIVDFLLNAKRWKKRVNEANNDGETALHIASEKGHLALVTRLLKAGARADKRDSQGNTALHRTLKPAFQTVNYDVFNLLLKHQRQNNALNGRNKAKQTLLSMVITDSHGFYVAQLFAQGADIHQRNQQQQTLLHQLTANDFLYDYKTIVAKKLTNQQLLTLMKSSAHHNDIATRVEWLLRHRIDINAVDNQGNTALHHLAKLSDKTVFLKRLLQQKPLLNAVNKKGNTALYLAVQAQAESVPLLLKAGANTNIAGEQGKTPLYLAVEHDNLSLVEQLLKHGAKINQGNQDNNQGKTPLFALVDAGTSAAMVERLVAAGLDLTRKDKQGNSIVQALANSASKDAALPRLRMMIAKGDDLNRTNTALETSLHQAILSHAPKTAQELLASGANPNIQDKDGATALHYAVRLRGFKQIEQLIENKVDLDRYNRFGKTALHIAVEQGDQALVKRLLAAGASAHSLDKDWRTPLLTAVAENHTALAILLLQHDANVNAMSKGGWRALHMAAEQGNEELLHRLLAYGADPQMTLWRGDTVERLVEQSQQAADKKTQLLKLLATVKPAPNIKLSHALRIAACNNDQAQLQQLLQQGADINQADRYGQTALHCAIEGLHVSLVEWLLAQGADPNQADLYQQTPLEKSVLVNAELALYSEHMLKALLAKGANVNTLNRHNETVLLVAIHNKTRLQKIQLLLEQGADVNTQDALHNTPLMEASRQGKVAIVKRLIAHKARLNQQDKLGNTSLHIALSTPIKRNIPYLLTPAQNPQQLSDEERQAFMQQAENNYRQLINALIDNGSDSHLLNNKGQSPLALAVNSQRLQISKKLLIQASDNDNLVTLALQALQQQQFPIALALLQQNRSVTLNDKMSWALLTAACRLKDQVADQTAANIVSFLLANGAKQALDNSERKITLLSLVTKYDVLATLRVLQGAGLTLKQPFLSAEGIEQPLLSLAATHNAVKIADFLLNQQINAVDDVDAKGTTALMVAAKAGAEEIVSLLLARQANANQQDEQQQTALSYAMSGLVDDKEQQQRALRISQKLQQQGANLSSVPQALHLAIKSKNDVLIAYLINKASYQVKQRIDGNTALYVALKHFKTVDSDEQQRAELARIRYLIAKGADVNQPNGLESKGVYPLQQALSHPALLSLLLQHKAQLKPLNAVTSGDTLFHELVRKHDKDAFNDSLAVLLKASRVANTRITARTADKQGNTPLHLLLQRNGSTEKQQVNQIAKLKLLLKHLSVDALNVKNKEQYTPFNNVLNLLNNASNDSRNSIESLVLTLLERHPKINKQHVLQACHSPVVLRELFAQGATVNGRDHTDSNCLHYVLRAFKPKRSIAALKLLLQQGINLNQQDEQGKTALHYLVAHTTNSEAQEKALALLWSGEAKPNVRLRSKKTGRTALFFASNVTLVKQLLQQGFAIHATDNEGNTVLQTTKNSSIAKYLVDNGIRLEHKNKRGETALLVAIKQDRSEYIEYLLSKGANPNLIDANGNSILHTVRSTALAERFLANGADVNYRNQDGDTPLHIASSLAIAQLFVVYKAKLNQQNKAGQSALIRMVIRDTPTSTKIAQFLLEQGADSSLKDQWQETALFKTAYTNNLTLAKQLLAKGAKRHVRNRLDDYPLHVALSKKHQRVAEVLMDQQKAEWLNVANWEQKTPLAFAFDNEQFGIATLLSNQGANKPTWPADLLAQEGNPFHLQRALQSKLARVAAQLLMTHARVSDKEIRRRVSLNEYGTGQTNLHLAALFGANELIPTLLQYGANINSLNNKHETPLQLAVQHQHFDTVKTLLAHHATLNIIDDAKQTVLHHASQLDNADILTFLLHLISQSNTSLNINAYNDRGETALHIACRQQNEAAVNVLLQHQASQSKVNKQGMTPLLIAVKTGNEAIIKQLLAYDANVHQRDKEGRTALLILVREHIYFNNQPQAQRDHQKIRRLIDLMLQYGADLHAKGKDGRRLVHIAMPIKELAHHVLDLVQAADLHQRDSEGSTPLFHAVSALYSKQNPVEIPMRLLLMDRLLIKHQNKWGETALQKAIRATNIDAMRLLIKQGVDVNATNKGGYTPLLDIIRNGVIDLSPQSSRDFVTLLLNKGADINKVDKYDNTPLHVAITEQHDEMAQFLIEHHAALNQQNSHAETPLHLLAQRRVSNDKEEQQDTIDLVDSLLAKKVDVDQRNNNSSTALHLAVQQQQLTIMTRLLANGADSSAATTRGETPLHLAVEQGDKAAVQQLLTHGASVDAKDNAGNQPLHNAILQRNKAIIELLLQAGGDVNSANYVGNTPLAIARELGMSKMFSIYQ